MNNYEAFKWVIQPITANRFFIALAILLFVGAVVFCSTFDFTANANRIEKQQKEDRTSQTDKYRMQGLPPNVKIIEKKSELFWVIEIDGVKYIAQYYHDRDYDAKLILFPK